MVYLSTATSLIEGGNIYFHTVGIALNYPTANIFSQILDIQIVIKKFYSLLELNS
ncbi:hypothetical protein C8N25_12715 [Algoriphagus antarcticus]|uniref:Uncharacterized protein n=1 Tax=Algoriphagus antarcticus TaxID=238540 RepID=A0A3E0DH17_9BACT|nr:hypothetical protein C8N25_12715 [Algoriphagus antarcticus]